MYVYMQIHGRTNTRPDLDGRGHMEPCRGLNQYSFGFFFPSSKISLGVKLVDVPVALVGEEIVGYLKNAMGMECSRYLNHHQRHSLNLVQLVLTLNSCC